MTAPDHRPYLLPADMRTAEDVARWLHERAERALHATTPPSVLALHYVHADLRARLDRERRQACRRGCFAMFRESHVWREAERACHPGEWRDEYRKRRATCLARALAFRAAAKPQKGTP